MKNIKQIVFAGILTLSSVAITSCGGAETGTSSTGWTESERTEFIKGCVKQASVSVTEDQATNLCSCMLDKMSSQYSTVEASQKMSIQEIQTLSADCAKSILQE